VLTVREVAETKAIPGHLVDRAGPDSLTDGLGDPDAWAGVATTLLADLGFTLVNSHQVAAAPSHLLVALRDRPTLAHFDPETVSFYEPADGRGRVTVLDRWAATASPSRRVLWGHLHLVDRRGVENRFLSFGGELHVAEVDPGLIVLDLSSPGPIARWGGHSQGVDALASEMGAFFARLIVPVDFRPGAESMLDEVRPEVLYAAFVLDLSARLHSARDRGAHWGELDGWLSLERLRLRADESSRLAAKLLLADLMLGS